MAKKVKTITLTHGYVNGTSLDEQCPQNMSYRVESVTDSIEYYPHQILGREVVNRLCNCDEWKVIIKPNLPRD